MNATERRQMAERVIAGARHSYGETDAGFDLYTTINGLGHPKFGYLATEVYKLTEGAAPAHLPWEQQADIREARQSELWAELADELAAYVDRCCSQRYVDFSEVGEGPYHYATV